MSFSLLSKCLEWAKVGDMRAFEYVKADPDISLLAVCREATINAQKELTYKLIELGHERKMPFVASSAMYNAINYGSEAYYFGLEIRKKYFGESSRVGTVDQVLKMLE
jgi:hypothetical protein